jgi:hypothetical protein
MLPQSLTTEPDTPNATSYTKTLKHAQSDTRTVSCTAFKHMPEWKRIV